LGGLLRYYYQASPSVVRIFGQYGAAVGKTIVSSGLIDRVVERRAYHIGELAIGRQVAGLSPKGRKD
jgi:phosphoglucomutase